MQRIRQPQVAGIIYALMTPVFLGMAPIFGKLAITAGADSFTVAALRTVIAVVILWVTYLLFFRQYIFIYLAGLSGCVIIGVINGIGSLFYYSGLGLLDASLTQLLNGMYLLFALILTRMGGERITSRVLIRGLLGLLALVIITGTGTGPINWLGVGLMLASALMFAGTVIFSQYVLFEMPAPTATLYILTTMAVIVTMAWLPGAAPLPAERALDILWPIAMLGLTTALARLMLFAGVKFLGSLQTAVTAIAEIGVALILAYLVLDERLTGTQWLGVAILGLSLLLIRSDDLAARGINPNRLLVDNMASVQFQRIAFHRAFGTRELDNDQETMSTLTTGEMKAIQRMMGAREGPIDPFPSMRQDQESES